MTIKKSYRFLFLGILLSSIVSCTKNNKHTGFVDPNEELLVGLTEVSGYDHTYNYDFNILKTRENVSFYVPTTLSEGLNRIPAEMRNKINTISNSDLPFTVNQVKSNIVTSWNESNQLVFQIQMSYLENDESYDTNFKDFFIVSITQYPNDPFAQMDETTLATLNEDLTKRQYEFLDLADGYQLYYLPISLDNSWPRMFDYYNYNADEKRIYKESTASYNYYAWYNGLIYKIGFNMDISSIDAEALVKKIILGN